MRSSSAISPCEAPLRKNAHLGRRPHVFLTALVSLLLGLCCAGQCLAQSDALTVEYKVKAAYLYKMAGYVQWPEQSLPNPESPFVIGVLGADRLVDELQAVVTGKTVGSHQVMLRKLHRGDPPTGIHILFVGRAESMTVPATLAALRGKPVLTVTEFEADFLAGSVINFVLVDDKVRFDIAPRQGELANLKISARLLTVARKIVGEP